MRLFLVVAWMLWMGVDSVRTGRTNPWLWVVLLFGPIGATIYFFTQYLPDRLPAQSLDPHRWSKPNLEHARRETRRLDHADAWTDYAAALRASGRHAESVEAARTALARDPDSLDATYLLGRGLLDDDRPDDALEVLRRVVERAPDHDRGEARFALAAACGRSGDLEGARAELEALVELRGRPPYLFALASVLERVGQPGAARGHLQRILDEAEDAPRYLRREIRPWVRKARAKLRRLE